jgi:hypothetical protein
MVKGGAGNAEQGHAELRGWIEGNHTHQPVSFNKLLLVSIHSRAGHVVFLSRYS